MPSIDIVIDSEISRSIRCRQLESMFDVPPQSRSKLKWNGNLPIEKGNWNVGLIVGSSGSGKSIIGKEVFKNKYTPSLIWKGKAVIDDFDKKYPIDEVAKVCQAVGFNTIPAWFRPYKVLSTGEKFRVDLARRMLELDDPIVLDEFTSVVDRQVAKIGAYAVQKYFRKLNKKFVGITCHYDVVDWLMPDWIFEPATMKYQQRPRGLLRRPKIKVEIRKVEYGLWKLFAPFHYLTAELNKAARCFALFIDDQPVSFTSILHYPNPRVKNIKRFTRSVTLPDWQGMGLSPFLTMKVASAYKALGFRVRNYPAHPAYIRALLKDPNRKLVKKPNIYQKTQKGITSKVNPNKVCRPCAVFEFVGNAMDKEKARKLIDGR